MSYGKHSSLAAGPRTINRLAVAVVVATTLTVSATPTHAQGQNGTPTVWIELPSFNDDNGN